jgi:hypothetical protein
MVEESARAKTRLSHARPQQATRRRGTNRASCGPFAYSLDLGERDNPSYASDIRVSVLS